MKGGAVAGVLTRADGFFFYYTWMHLCFVCLEKWITTSREEIRWRGGQEENIKKKRIFTSLNSKESSRVSSHCKSDLSATRVLVISGLNKMCCNVFLISLQTCIFPWRAAQGLVSCWRSLWHVDRLRLTHQPLCNNSCHLRCCCSTSFLSPCVAEKVTFILSAICCLLMRSHPDSFFPFVCFSLCCSHTLLPPHPSHIL